jgi:hypothetical protein
MKHVKTTMIASAIALSLGTANVLADSWTILQTGNLNTNATTLTQNVNGSTGATGSVQAINNINLGNNGVIDAGSTQDLNTSQNITFDQDSAGADNIQAVNNAVAPDVTGLTQTLTSGATQTITFEQGVDATSDTGNVQAVNRVKATTVTALSQSITGTGNTTLDFDQAPNGADQNIQAGNLIDVSTDGDTISTTDGDVSQTVNVLESNMEQNLTTTSLQANNALITPTTSSGGGGSITQTFTNGTLAMTQTGTNGSVQSGNYVGKKLW